MPEPRRVYADFKDNYPNFYVYYGNPADKTQELKGANTKAGIERICSEQGLQPVEIQDPSQYQNIVDYLTQSGFHK